MFYFIVARQCWLSVNRFACANKKSVISVVAGDLVLEIAEEASLCLLLVTMLINDPFLIFEELAVLNESLMNIGLAVGTSSTMSVRVAFNSDSSSGTSMNMSCSMSV